jgi:hypothetical protein
MCKQKGHYANKCSENGTTRLQWTEITEGCRRVQGEDTIKYSQLKEFVCSYSLEINVVRTCKS